MATFIQGTNSEPCPLFSGGEYVFILHAMANILTTISQFNSTRYPVWASLAQDYLPIMASSVSSKHAFSSAGITISKRRNRLKPDIVKALQFLKCLYHRDLTFWEEASTASELGMEMETEDHVEQSVETDGWDTLVGDLQEDEGSGFQDYDDKEVFVQDIE